jgi:RecA-family ATPase
VGTERQHSGLITIKELRERPPVDWLIPDFLPEKALVEAYAPPGSYKTFVWMDVGLCLASGKPWHGLDPKQGAVVYICGESSDKLQLRLDAWYYSHGYNTLTSQRVPFYMTPRAYSVYDQGEVDDVLRFIRLRGITPVLVVYDTLGACRGGGPHPYNENDASDFHVLRDNMARIRDETGATVVQIAHEGLSARKTKTGAEYRAPNGGPRGTSAQRGDKGYRMRRSRRSRHAK